MSNASDWQPLTDYSSFARRCLNLWPDACQQLLDKQRLQQPGVSPAQLPESASLDQLNQYLRCYRQTEALRICWRDVKAQADLSATLTELSRLAEHCLQAALSWHRDDFEQRFGSLHNAAGDAFDFAIIALGKLGGAELNFSSDIDIMFVHDGCGRSDGRRRLHADDYVNRLGRAVCNSLHRVQEGGRVYRVDTRLRPFGDSGALVWSRQAMEQYYVQQGRDWERFALQKARVVAGDSELGNGLLNDLQPFIYRRYLDYGLFEGIREMHAEILRQGERLGQREHLKLGAGGIREIEFLVQSLQLLRGGRQPDLRHPNLLISLQRLVCHDYLAADEAQRLRAAYMELRKLENRLQMRDDRQLHQLPATASEQETYARFCGYADWASLYQVLQQHRQQVSALFAEHLGSDAHGAAANQPAAAETDSTQPGIERSVHSPLQALKDAGMATAELESLHQGIERKLQDASAHHRWQSLQPLLLNEALRSKAPARAYRNALSIIDTIARRSNYLALLLEMPQARQRMIELCADGGYLVQSLQANPLLLDDLVDPQLLHNLEASAGDLRQRIQTGINALQDAELQWLQLHHWKQSYQFRIAGNEWLGRIDALQARQQLSWLAEAVISISLDCCRRNSGLDVDLAVIAFGSLGAAEMHYSSDLDLVFLYADEDRAQEYAATRLVQKLMHWLNTPGSGQRLYAIDTRLRPNGRSGTLVSSMAAFADYQQQHAWVWEWQSLSRARCICADADLSQAFKRIRHDILVPAHEATVIGQPVLEMYARICSEHKLAEESLAACRLRIQFLLQYWLLTLDLHAYHDVSVGTIPRNGLEQMHMLADLYPQLQQPCASLQPLWIRLLQARNQAQLKLSQAPAATDIAAGIDPVWQQFLLADHAVTQQPN